MCCTVGLPRSVHIGPRVLDYAFQEIWNDNPIPIPGDKCLYLSTTNTYKIKHYFSNTRMLLYSMCIICTLKVCDIKSNYSIHFSNLVMTGWGMVTGNQRKIFKESPGRAAHKILKLLYRRKQFTVRVDCLICRLTVEFSIRNGHHPHS